MRGPWKRGQRGERPDVTLCLFPHLKEFLVVDARGDELRILLLKTEDVLTEGFFSEVERSFSKIVRLQAGHPLTNLTAMPERVDEILRAHVIREILSRIGGEEWGEGKHPRIAVLTVTGPALHMEREQLAQFFQTIIARDTAPAFAEEWVELMLRLVEEEREALRKLERQELRQALEGQSERFFTLWDSHN